MKQHIFIIVALFGTLATFGIIWAEDAWSEFYRWGPPFQVGSLVIKTWPEYLAFVGLLVIYQMSRVYIEETSGRTFEKAHVQGTEKTNVDVVFMSLFNLYSWLGTILHILVAVTRLDVWFALAVIDTLMRASMWAPTTGRRPRVFKL